MNPSRNWWRRALYSDLPRPRALDGMGDPRFVAVSQTIRGHFFAQGTIDA